MVGKTCARDQGVGYCHKESSYWQASRTERIVPTASAERRLSGRRIMRPNLSPVVVFPRDETGCASLLNYWPALDARLRGVDSHGNSFSSLLAPLIGFFTRKSFCTIHNRAATGCTTGTPRSFSAVVMSLIPQAPEPSK